MIVVVRAHKQTWTLLIKFMSWYVLSDHQNRLRIDLRAVVYIYIFGSIWNAHFKLHMLYVYEHTYNSLWNGPQIYCDEWLID